MLNNELIFQSLFLLFLLSLVLSLPLAVSVLFNILFNVLKKLFTFSALEWAKNRSELMRDEIAIQCAITRQKRNEKLPNVQEPEWNE